MLCSKCRQETTVTVDGHCLPCWWPAPAPQVVIDPTFLQLVHFPEEAPPLATPMTLWVQKWEERESGWGSRPDGYTLHLKREDIAQFLRDMRAEEYKTHQGAVPDEYSTTSGEPYEWDTTDAALVEVVRAAELGVKRHGPPPQPKPGVDPGGWMPVKEPCATCGCARVRHAAYRRSALFLRGTRLWCRDCKPGVCRRFVPVPDPATIYCGNPYCRKIHVDEGVFATKPHEVHVCVTDAAGVGCGHSWRIEGPPVRGVLPAPDAPRHFAVTSDEEDAPDGARIFLDGCNAEYERVGMEWRMVGP